MDGTHYDENKHKASYYNYNHIQKQDIIAGFGTIKVRCYRFNNIWYCPHPSVIIEGFKEFKDFNVSYEDFNRSCNW